MQEFEEALEVHAIKIKKELVYVTKKV